MKLFHVSTYLDHNGFFNPRIPVSTIKNEDQTIPRVCTAKTIEGCLTALPNGPERLADYQSHGGYFKVFEIHSDNLNTLDSENLVSNMYVSDAEITGEVWVLNPIQVPQEFSKVIWIQDWDEENIIDPNSEMIKGQHSEVLLIKNLKIMYPLQQLGTQVLFPLLADECPEDQQSELTESGKLKFVKTEPVSARIPYLANFYKVTSEEIDMTDLFLKRWEKFRYQSGNDDFTMFIIPNELPKV